MNTSNIALLDRAAALISGALAVTGEADRRHLTLQAREVLSASGALVCRDVGGLLDDVLTGGADERPILQTAHAALVLEAEEEDAALAA